MKGKITAIALIIIVAVIALYGIYVTTESHPINETTLTVYMGSLNLSDHINIIKTESRYEGYDNETVKWLESLNPGNIVLFNKDTFVVMSKADADKIPMEFATDVSIDYTFKCNVVENRSLGKDLNDILYVDHVEYLRQNITYFEV